MTAPGTAYDNNPSRKSMIPVFSKSARSLLPAPTTNQSTQRVQCPPATKLPENSVKIQATARTPDSKVRQKKSNKPVPATQSLSMGRSASATQIEIQRTPNAKGRPPVLSYNKLSQENRQLRTDLSVLREKLSETELETREERNSLKSEIELLSESLAKSNASVSQLSEQSSREQERVNILESVMERVGIDPLSGEEVLGEADRREARITAREKTKSLSESLHAQIHRFEEMCVEIEEKRRDMLSLTDFTLSPVETGSCLDESFDMSLASPIITEQPVPLQ